MRCGKHNQNSRFVTVIHRMSCPVETQLRRASARASKKLEMRRGELHRFGIQIEVLSSDALTATVSYGPSISLQISSGCVSLLERSGTAFARKHVVPTALEWLILHELSHVTLGHFELAETLGVAERERMRSKARNAQSNVDCPLVPMCLEMQADHEATDTLLGIYSSEDWHLLREKVSAISHMMMLIEMEDAKNNFQGCTHPRAATRIFQLLGHVAEMPLVQAHVSHDASLLPTESELQEFAHDVTIPCFFDVVQLAQAAGAVSIASDLGSSESFFKDLEIAKLGSPSRYADLKTQGAQEWARLWPCNEALKPALGGYLGA